MLIYNSMENNWKGGLLYNLLLLKHLNLFAVNLCLCIDKI